MLQRLNRIKWGQCEPCFDGIDCNRKDCGFEHPSGRSSKPVESWSDVVPAKQLKLQVEDFFASAAGRELNHTTRAKLQELELSAQLYVIDAFETADAKRRVQNPTAFMTSVIGNRTTLDGRLNIAQSTCLPAQSVSMNQLDPQVERFFARVIGSEFDNNVKLRLQKLTFKEQLHVLDTFKTADAKSRVHDPAAFLTSAINGQNTRPAHAVSENSSFRNKSQCAHANHDSDSETPTRTPNELELELARMNSGISKSNHNDDA